MEKKEVTLVTPTTIGSITVIPLVKLTVNGWEGKYGLGLYGSIQPEIIVINTPSDKKALRITGEEVPLDQMVEEFPDVVPFMEEIQ